MKKIITSTKTPKAIGPYSIAIEAQGFVYCSGQLGLHPETGDLVEGGVEPQAKQALANLANVLEAAGCSMEDVVKTTIFLVDMKDFPAVNAIYGTFFTQDFPARSTVAVAALPKGGSFEIEAVATKK